MIHKFHSSLGPILVCMAAANENSGSSSRPAATPVAATPPVANRILKPELVTVRVRPLLVDDVEVDPQTKKYVRTGTQTVNKEKRHILEDGRIYKTGETFQTSAERAEALATEVEVIAPVVVVPLA